MSIISKRRGFVALAAATAALALSLSACSSTPAPSGSPTATGDAAQPATVDIQDNHGTQTVTLPPQRVIATDNRLFQTLSDWGIPLVAAPVDLIPASIAYKTDSSIVNLGAHREPNLEAIVATNPDLILNGQRFQSFYEDIKKLAPEAAMIELDPREGQPFDAELKRQVETLGTLFDRKADADKLVADFDAAVARVKAAYDPSQKVMAVITSGGEINYAAPGTGRTLGPVFDILGLTPALEAEGSTDHQGDDISVEAIAQSNPDIILVMDRDAAVAADSEEYKPANELLAGSEALKNVTAVKNGAIVYMPKDTYTNEGIQTYTTFFSSLADALEAK